jgi:hypothetical protein
VSRAVVAKDLVAAVGRSLKMPGLVRVFEALARQAREEHWGYEEYLHEVLRAEETSRRDSAIRQRIRDAHFPETKTLDSFDLSATEGINAALIPELARGEWIARGENIILAVRSAPARHIWPSRSASRRHDNGAASSSIARPTSSAFSSKRVTNASWAAFIAAFNTSSFSSSTNSGLFPSIVRVASSSSTSSPSATRSVASS